MFWALGVTIANKMVSRGSKDRVNLKLPKTFKEVSNLTKPNLKEILGEVGGGHEGTAKQVNTKMNI